MSRRTADRIRQMLIAVVGPRRPPAGRRRACGAVFGPVGVTLARKAAVYKVELSGQSRFKRTHRGAEQGGTFCVASDAPRAGRGPGSAAEGPGGDRGRR